MQPGHPVLRTMERRSSAPCARRTPPTPPSSRRSAGAGFGRPTRRGGKSNPRPQPQRRRTGRGTHQRRLAGRDAAGGCRLPTLRSRSDLNRYLLEKDRLWVPSAGVIAPLRATSCTPGRCAKSRARGFRASPGRHTKGTREPPPQGSVTDRWAVSLRHGPAHSLVGLVAAVGSHGSVDSGYSPAPARSSLGSGSSAIHGRDGAQATLD
jgi:hypothetical protein